MDARRHRVMIREQSRMLQKEQRAMDAHVAAQRALDATWLMPKEMIERAEMIASFLVRVPAAVQRNQAILDEAERSVPTAQLEAQLRHELLRSAASWSAEEWQMIDDLRSQQSPGSWVPDATERAA